MVTLQDIEKYINEQVNENKLTREHADELIEILYGEEQTTHHTVNALYNSKTNTWILDDIHNHNVNPKYKIMFTIDYEGYYIFHKKRLPHPAFNRNDVENMLDEILAKEDR